MSNTLAVDINRTGRQSLEVPSSFEAEGPFAVELRNHGEGAHVYLNLDDALTETAALGATNQYVESKSSENVRVHVDPDSEATVRGKLKVATGYGAETRYVDVTIDQSPDQSIEVDPSLSEPRGHEDTQESAAPAGLDAIPAVVLGLVAFALAIGAVISASPANLAFAALAVISAAIAAAYYTFR